MLIGRTEQTYLTVYQTKNQINQNNFVYILSNFFKKKLEERNYLS